MAPLLNSGRPPFPEAYLDAVLDDALATYPVDRERITATGLSMGGEATYHLGRHRPEVLAGIAVLCGFEAGTWPEAAHGGFRQIREPAAALAGMPALVVHGDDDQAVPLWAAKAAVDELVAARGRSPVHRARGPRPRRLDRNLRRPGLLRLAARVAENALTTGPWTASLGGCKWICIPRTHVRWKLSRGGGREREL